MTQGESKNGFNLKKSGQSLTFAIWPFVGITMVFGFIGSLGVKNWIPDLASQFFVQYFVVQFVFCVLLLASKKMKQVLLLAPFLILSLFKIVPLYIDDTDRIKLTGSEPQFSILQVNLNSSNNEYGKVLTCVEKFDPDFIVFEEVTKAWQKHLSKGLKDGYIIIDGKVRKDPFGILLFSKQDAINSKILNLGYKEIPSVVSEFEVQGSKFTIFAVHVVPPITGSLFRERNLMYDEIALYRKKATDRIILVGDLNTTSWSPFFQDLLTKSNLLDSSIGKGVQPTWPSHLPILGIPIDHCLHSKEFQLVRKELGPDVGSDHRPVYLKFAVVK